MDGMSIQQVTVDSPEYRQVYDLRETVLRVPIGLSLANEDLSGDKDDTILAAVENGTIAGCLMLQHKDDDAIKFRQMAVTDKQQGKGIGNLLIAAGEKLSREKGYKKVILHARESASGFYLKAGYEITSGLFSEVGIPHYVMEKDIQ
jgi:predicted GNAT family N-acyltransferase